MNQQGESSFRWVVGALLLIGLATFLGGVVGRRQSKRDAEEAPAPTVEVKPDLHPVSVRRPSGPPRVLLSNDSGEKLTTSCSNCHANRPADPLNTTADKLDEFHQGLKVAHGNVACLSCHNSEDYDTLKLANGDPVEYTNVMKLCSQCHGKQANDYAHGAHGGMTGHWDLTRGPRQRHNCVDCHDPHSPEFPAMTPTFKPQDRFLESKHHGEHAK